MFTIFKKHYHHEKDHIAGQPVELIIRSLKGGGVNTFTHKVKIVTVGENGRQTHQPRVGTLRSSDITLLGSGLGSLSQTDLHNFSTTILPEMFQLAAEGKLKINTRTEELKDIAKVWDKELESGKGLVILID